MSSNKTFRFGTFIMVPHASLLRDRRWCRLSFRASLLALLCAFALSNAQLAQASDVQLCPADRPCFNGYRQVGNKVIFNFTGVTGWDFYNVRYAAVGGGEKQVENRSGRFTFNNVKPRRVYTLSVQGCRSRFLARSVCSPWVAQSVTTR